MSARASGLLPNVPNIEEPVSSKTVVLDMAQQLMVSKKIRALARKSRKYRESKKETLEESSNQDEEKERVDKMPLAIFILTGLMIIILFRVRISLTFSVPTDFTST